MKPSSVSSTSPDHALAGTGRRGSGRAGRAADAAPRRPGCAGCRQRSGRGPRRRPARRSGVGSITVRRPVGVRDPAGQGQLDQHRGGHARGPGLIRWHRSPCRSCRRRRGAAAPRRAQHQSWPDDASARSRGTSRARTLPGLRHRSGWTSAQNRGMPPNWRSPASPRPGTMNARSFSPSSIDAVTSRSGSPESLQPRDALRRGQHAQHGDVGAAAVGEQPAAVLQRAAGGQHRVEHQHRHAGQVGRAATPCRPAARRSPRRGPARRSPSRTRAAAPARRRPCPGRPAAPAPAAAGWPAGCPRSSATGVCTGNVSTANGAGRLVHQHRGQLVQRGPERRRSRCGRRAWRSAATGPAGGPRRVRPRSINLPAVDAVVGPGRHSVDGAHVDRA